MSNIGVLGAGTWGIALARMLHNNGHNVCVWSALEKEVTELRAKLEEKTIAIAQSGTMAEAALRLSGVYKAVDQAAANYLRNVQQRCREMEEETRRRCDELLQQAKTGDNL